MALIKKNLIVNILGTTKSGKFIHQDPKMNAGFKRQDHLDAYRAHASFLMRNELEQQILEKHLLAMNEHYLQAANGK